MANKTPAEKMRWRPGTAVALLHLPASLRETLGFSDDVTFTDDLDAAGFILAAASTHVEAEARLTELAPHASETTLVWLVCPKGSKAAGRDISRDTVWRFARTVGLALVANVAVDETWSALRIQPEKGVGPKP